MLPGHVCISILFKFHFKASPNKNFNRQKKLSFQLLWRQASATSTTTAADQLQHQLGINRILIVSYCFAAETRISGHCATTNFASCSWISQEGEKKSWNASKRKNPTFFLYKKFTLTPKIFRLAPSKRIVNYRCSFSSETLNRASRQ